MAIAPSNGTKSIEKILQKWKPELSSFKNHAGILFTSIITHEMRKLNKSVGHSDWSLLKRSSEKQLKESLVNFGVSYSDELEKYLLAWDCYKEKFSYTRPKGNDKLSAPDNNTWQEITNLYNNLRKTNNPQVEMSTLQKWIDICIKAIRRNISPPIDSLNRKFSTDGDIELEDNLSSGEGESLLEQIIRDEEENNREENLDKFGRIFDSTMVCSLENMKSRVKENRSDKQSQNIR